MDFGQCLVDTAYQDRLYIHNLHNSALRFWLDFAPFKVIPHEGVFRVEIPSIGNLELSTSFGFVQPLQALPVWFTLILSTDSYEFHQFKPFKLPFTVNYIESQTKTQRKVPILLTGTIADHKVLLKSPPIDFGITSILETRQKDIMVINLSQLPQIIQISSSDACVTLLDTPHHCGDYMLLKPLEEVRDI
jgi:hypothetical protein